MMLVPVLAFLRFGSVSVWAHSITGNGIQLCLYWYWHFFILVYYQYGHGPLPELIFSGARTGISIFALWFSTSMGTFNYQYWHSMGPVPVFAISHVGSEPVWIHSITGTGIQLCPYQYWHFCTWFSASMGTFHYWYQQSMMPVPVLAFLHFGSVSAWAHSITGIGIQWCQYRYWHLCILVQYQYSHGTLPVLALNGACTSIGIFALLSSTSMGTLHYRYWH
jgi:hypothetical protein